MIRNFLRLKFGARRRARRVAGAFAGADIRGGGGAGRFVCGHRLRAESGACGAGSADWIGAGGRRGIGAGAYWSDSVAGGTPHSGEIRGGDEHGGAGRRVRHPPRR
jgi:hypothetical protein